MLLVRTYLGPSAIHGIGLFAAQSISPGATIWKFDPRIDSLISREALNHYPLLAKELVEIYAEYHDELDLFVLSGDNDRFMNHSDDPNTETVEKYSFRAPLVARRFIASGDEITCDYNIVKMLRYGWEE